MADVADVSGGEVAAAETVNAAKVDERDASASPKVKYTVLPCVAHPVYSKHQNCGCLRSRSASPKKLEPQADWPEPEPVPVPMPPSEPRVQPFYPPQLLASVPAPQLRHVATATDALAVSTAENNGTVIHTRHSVTGATVGEVPLLRDAVGVTALARVGAYLWCGFQNGLVRVFGDATPVFEATKHSGAIRAIIAAGGFIFTASNDWKIVKWTPNGAAKWKASAFGSHTLAARCLCEATTQAASLLCSGGDDSEIRCWLLSASGNFSGEVVTHGTGTAFFSLKADDKSVLSVGYAFDKLWSGSEDGTVRAWSLSQRAPLHSANDHSCGVMSIQPIGSRMWTMSKDGFAVMYEGTSMDVVHTMKFGDNNFKQTTSRWAAQMFCVAPVSGHILWVSDAKGKTTSWLAQSDATTEAAPAQHTAPSQFEESERQVELYFRAEAAQRAMIDGLCETIQSTSDSYKDLIVACTSELGTVPQKPLESDDSDELAALREELAAARAFIQELSSEQNTSDDAVDQLRALLREAQQDALSACGARDELRMEVERLNVENAELRSAMGSSSDDMYARVEALNRTVADLTAKNEALQLELDQARRDALANANDAASAEVERLSKLLGESAERERKLVAEAQQRESLIDRLLLEKDEAVAQLALADVQSVSDASGLKQQVAELTIQNQRLRDDLDATRQKLDEAVSLLEERTSELLRFQALMKDRDVHEAAVRGSYEDRIAELTRRLNDLQLQLDASSQMGDDRDELKRRLAELSSPKYAQLAADNAELKRQLGEHRAHIARLLETESAMEAALRKIKEERNSEPTARRSESQPTHHDPSCPHHKATCIWCSGAINVSMGSTFNVPRPNLPHHDHDRRSRSRSPMPKKTRDASAERSASAPEPSNRPGHEDAPSPTTFSRRRVKQLERAQESATNDAVRSALAQQILSLHAALQGSASPVPAE